MGEHHIKPSARSQAAESRLRATPEVYHPAVKSTKAQHQVGAAIDTELGSLYI